MTREGRRGEDQTGTSWRGTRFAWTLFTAAVFAAVLLAPAAAFAQEPTVVTTTGTFTAVPSLIDPGAVDVFYGIRYAAPPQGALRWAPPQAPMPPAGTAVASTPGNACPQGSSAGQSEDCLFLNVYIPASARPHSRLPVFFWIHGGSLTGGAGAEYDASDMVANHGIIVVTINYRLGALGWLVEPGLAAAAANAFQAVGDAGNYGLMDQQFAMQWVQANIAAFGGDPAKVTIAGESAGGLSVSSNLASTITGAGLFRSAIIESGAYMLHDVPSQQAYQASFGAAFDQALGCTQPADAACLRGQSVDAILAAQQVFGANGISPDWGTRVLPLGLHAAFSTGTFNQVPVLQGSNANEGRLFEPGFVPLAASLANVAAAGGPANYDLANANSFCGTAQTPATCTYPQEIGLFLAELSASPSVNSVAIDNALAALYPLGDFPDPYLPNNAPSADEGLAQIFTDVAFSCNTWDSDSDLARWVPLYAYEFNDPQAPPLDPSVVAAPNDQFGYPTASEHAAELQFLFAFGTPLTIGEQHLSAEMQAYWANFTISNNPNVGSPTPFFAPWTPFNFIHAIQALVPAPGVPQPFYNFQANHLCNVWEPIISAE